TGANNNPYTGADITLTNYEDVFGQPQSLSSAGLGNANITNGKLDFTLGTPTGGWVDLTSSGTTVNPGNTKILIILGFTDGSNHVYNRYYSGGSSSAVYIYADKNVTLSGNGIDGQVRLAKGWNYAILKTGNELSSGEPDASYKWLLIQ
ncbi:MAG: hypothetical protein LBH35_10020, partial [Treponema sp.]|nr:hypothetical protein [Treponema sp.]